MLLESYLKDKLNVATLKQSGLSIKSTRKSSSDFSWIQTEFLDIAGEDAEQFLANLKPGSIDLVLLTYDITDLYSFLNLDKWLNLLFASDAIAGDIFLVGNKSDLETKRQVQQEEAMNYAKNHGIFFFEVSAKQGKNIDELFEHVKSAFNMRQVDERMNFLPDAHANFPELKLDNFLWYGAEQSRKDFEHTYLNINSNPENYLIKDLKFIDQGIAVNYRIKTNHAIWLPDRYEQLFIQIDKKNLIFYCDSKKIRLNSQYTVGFNSSTIYNKFKEHVDKFINAETYHQQKLQRLIKRYLECLRMDSHKLFLDPFPMILGFEDSDRNLLVNELNSGVSSHLASELKIFSRKLDAIGKAQIEIVNSSKPRHLLATEIESHRQYLRAVCLSILRSLVNFPELYLSISLKEFTELIRYIYYEFYHETNFSRLIDHILVDSQAYLLNYLHVMAQSTETDKICFYNEDFDTQTFLACSRIQNDLLYLTEKLTTIHQEYQLSSEREIIQPDSMYAPRFEVGGSYWQALGRISSFAAFKLLFLLKREQANNPRWKGLLRQILSEEKSIENTNLNQDFSLYGRYGLAGELLKEALKREEILSEDKRIEERQLYYSLWSYLIAIAYADNSIESSMEAFIHQPFLHSTDLLMFLLRK